MLKLGVIGTGAISHHFIEAAHASGQYQLVAVYSRKIETAATFASRYQDIQLFDQLEGWQQGYHYPRQGKWRSL